MIVSNKRHNKLNQKQLHTLTLLYKFRFITIPLLTEYNNQKHQSTTLRNLKVLLDQGLIGRYFNSSFKIDRKPAYYYLDKNGINLLKDDARFNSKVLHTFYKNKSVSESFMKHTIDVLEVFNSLKSTNENLDIFTKQEISSFDNFPADKPDLYVRGNNDYFINLAHRIPLYLTRKKLTQYIAHYEAGDWNNKNYPSILFVLNSGSDERRLLDYAKKSIESAGIDIDELNIGTTTMKAITRKTHVSSIWTFIDDINPASLD